MTATRIIEAPARAGVYDVSMPRRRTGRAGPYHGHTTPDAWLRDVQARQAATPTVEELRALVAVLLREGWAKGDVAEALGMSRQALHRYYLPTEEG